MKALSIRQPWAWLITHGYKRVENRSWRTPFRGEFLIHAAGKMTQNDYYRAFSLAFRQGIIVPHEDALGFGGIVGVATLVDCRPVDPRGEKDPFFFGPYGFILTDAEPREFIPCKGKLGFFNVES
jgi:hypothetical protein